MRAGFSRRVCPRNCTSCLAGITGSTFLCRRPRYPLRLRKDGMRLSVALSLPGLDARLIRTNSKDAMLQRLWAEPVRELPALIVPVTRHPSGADNPGGRSFLCHQHTGYNCGSGRDAHQDILLAGQWLDQGIRSLRPAILGLHTPCWAQLLGFRCCQRNAVFAEAAGLTLSVAQEPEPAQLASDWVSLRFQAGWPLTSDTVYPAELSVIEHEHRHDFAGNR
jgi:hypothetical protein